MFKILVFDTLGSQTWPTFTFESRSSINAVMQT